MLVLHIGLPKTGTSFLQQRVLAKAPGIVFVYRRQGPLEAAVCASLRSLAHTRLLAPVHRRRLQARLQALPDAGSRPILVSDENISLNATEFWRGGGGPQRLARRLGALAASLGQPLRVILGVRRQDQWLASRYAESSKHFASFAQDDFDRRAAGIAAAADLGGALGWLDYAGARAAFAAALGPEGVLVLPLERLAADPEAALAEVGGFLGGIDLRPPARGAKRPRNVLAVEENTWRLRRDGAPLRLAPALEAALRQRFAASNTALAAHVPLGFDP